MTILEALEAAKAGKRVRPCCWAGEKGPCRWAEYRPTGYSSPLFVECSSDTDFGQALRLEYEDELCGDWEILP